jgi:hypothetical protein
MKLTIITDCSGIDWQTIADSRKKVGMALFTTPQAMEKFTE